MEYIDEITKKVAGEIADFEKKHGYINGGFATGLARKYAIEAYNQAINHMANIRTLTTEQMEQLQKLVKK